MEKALGLTVNAQKLLQSVPERDRVLPCALKFAGALATLAALRGSVRRCPRVLAASSCSFLGWLALQAIHDNEGELLKRNCEQCFKALKATERFADVVAENFCVMSKEWLELFLPFFQDIMKLSVCTWNLLTPEQRWLLLASCVAALILLCVCRAILLGCRALRLRCARLRDQAVHKVIECRNSALSAVRRRRDSVLGGLQRRRDGLVGAVQRQRQQVSDWCQQRREELAALRRRLWHALLWLGWLPLWQSTYLLPTSFLAPCLMFAQSAAPTYFSLRALGFEYMPTQVEPPPPVPATPRSRWLWGFMTGAPQEAPPPPPRLRGSPVQQRQWLAYWSYWPFLALVELMLEPLSRAMALYSGDAALVKSHLQRVLFTLVLWMLWRPTTGAQSLLESTFLESMAQLLGALMSRACALLVGLRARLGLARAAALVAFLFRWKYVALAASGAAALLLVWLFYRAVDAFSSLFVWCIFLFAAGEAANTAHEAADQVTRKLSFWVLGMMWLAATEISGARIPLVTPVALCVSYIFGEYLLAKAILPQLLWAVPRGLRAVEALKAAVASITPSREAERRVPPDETPTEQETAEEPSGEEPATTAPSSADAEVRETRPKPSALLDDMADEVSEEASRDRDSEVHVEAVAATGGAYAAEPSPSPRPGVDDTGGTGGQPSASPVSQGGATGGLESSPTPSLSRRKKWVKPAQSSSTWVRLPTEDAQQ